MHRLGMRYTGTFMRGILARGDLDLLKWAMQRRGWSMKRVDIADAARVASVTVMKFLMKQGKKVDAGTLRAACASGSQPLVELLLTAGCAWPAPELDEAQWWGRSAGQEALRSGQQSF